MSTPPQPQPTLEAFEKKLRGLRAHATADFFRFMKEREVADKKQLFNLLSPQQTICWSEGCEGISKWYVCAEDRTTFFQLFAAFLKEAQTNKRLLSFLRAKRWTAFLSLIEHIGTHSQHCFRYFLDFDGSAECPFDCDYMEAMKEALSEAGIEERLAQHYYIAKNKSNPNKVHVVWPHILVNRVTASKITKCALSHMEQQVEEDFDERQLAYLKDKAVDCNPYSGGLRMLGALKPGNRDLAVTYAICEDHVTAQQLQDMSILPPFAPTIFATTEGVDFWKTMGFTQTELIQILQNKYTSIRDFLDTHKTHFCKEELHYLQGGDDAVILEGGGDEDDATALWQQFVSQIASTADRPSFFEAKVACAAMGISMTLFHQQGEMIKEFVFISDSEQRSPLFFYDKSKIFYTQPMSIVTRKQKQQKQKPQQKQEQQEEQQQEGQDIKLPLGFTQKDIAALVSMLSPKRADNRHDWINVGILLKLFNFPEGFSLWNKFSQQSDKYDGVEVLQQVWDSFSTLEDDITIGSLMFWAQQDSPTSYHRRKRRWLRGDQGHAEVLIELWEGSIITENAKGDGYVWNEDKCLWEYKNHETIVALIPKLLESECENEIKCQQLLKKQMKREQKDTSKIEERIRALQTALRKAQSLPHANRVFSIACNHPRILDKEIETKMNRISYLLAIQHKSVVNLRTGKTRPRCKNDYFSFECPVSMGNPENPHVWRFFNDIMLSQERTIYLRRILGASLTAEQVRYLFLCHGSGRNGKSTLFDIMKKIMGPFCRTVSSDVFIQNTKKRDPGAATPHLIPLIGARLCLFSESKENDALNQDELKRITGGDEIPVRKNYGSQFEFVPMCKLFMLTNPLPKLDVNDLAFIDRLINCPFETRFVKSIEHDLAVHPNKRLEDQELIQRLKDEDLSDVFAWLVQGAIEFYEKNVDTDVPRDFVQAKQAYLSDVDTLAQFLDEETLFEKGQFVTIRDLFDHYARWCEDLRLKTACTGPKGLTPLLKGRGYIVNRKRVNRSQQPVCFDISLSSTMIVDTSDDDEEK